MKIVLKASAGTGKTYRLSLEYIGALLRGESYKNILVMTFTKKATGEIEERVVDFLRILSGKNRDEKEKKEREALIDSLKTLYPDLEIEEGRFISLYEEICKNRDRLRIYTIDGFINRIFKSVIAPSLGMENYSLIDADEEREITGKLLEKIFKSKTSFKIFKSFLEGNMEKNIDSYIELLQTLLQERWRYILVKERYPENIPEKEAIPYLKDSYTPVEIADFIVKKITVMAEIKKKPISEMYQKNLSPYSILKTLEEKNSFIEENQDNFLSKNLWDGNKTKGKEVVELLNEMKTLLENLREKIRIDSFNSKILKYEREVLGFIEELYRNYDEIKLKEGKLTFSDISTYTYINYRDPKLGLVRDEKVTKYFQELFDGEIKTLFIDEFQDTSILQWKLLKAIGNSAERVFCVGDEKQSLYSWRGGEKELFEKLPEILPGIENTLPTSYRSRKNIVEFTNELFGKISQIYSDNNEGNWRFDPVKFVKTDDSYIETIYPELLDSEEVNEDQMDKICKILVERFKGNYKGIAVIARTGKELVEMGNRLSNLHIPFTLKSNKNIFEHRVNRGIFKFLKYLSYNDYFSLLEYFRDDSVGISSDDLKELVEKRAVIERNLSINKNLTDELESLNLSQEMLTLLVSVRENREIFEKYRGESKYVIPEIFKNLSPLERFGSSSDIENYYGFMEICKGFKRVGNLVKTAENSPSATQFSQKSVEDENAVTLITVHGSKGLEYDTVFYIHVPTGEKADKGLDFQIKLDNSYEKLENFIILNPKGRKLILSEEGDIFKQFDFLFKIPEKKLQEKINTWYVGLTRAKKNLFIVLDYKKLSEKTQDILMKALETMPLVVGEFQEQESILVVEKEVNSKVELEEEKTGVIASEKMVLNFRTPNISQEKIEENLIEQREFLRTSHNRQQRKLLGTAVHYYLENIEYLNPAEIEKSKISTISKFGGELGVENLKRILESSELKKSLEENRDIFSEDWDNIHSEFRIKLGNSEKRIDRLMVKKPKIEFNRELKDNLNLDSSSKGEILIVDYKTGARDESQLEGYEEAVRNLLKSEKIENQYNISSRFMSVNIPQLEEREEINEREIGDEIDVF